MNKERLSTPDLFLLNPPLRPKEAVAKYVESQGILVPRRFSGLKQALESERDFIIRSEHPQDYNGASGIVDSFVVKNDRVEKAKARVGELPQGLDWYKKSDEVNGMKSFEFTDSILANLENYPQEKIESAIKKLSGTFIRFYANLNEVSIESVENKVSFSYWELIDGKSQTIVADSSIENKYHIFTYKMSVPDNHFYYNYSVFENGQEKKSVTLGRDKSGIKNASQLIRFYERVRKLPSFDTGNVPTLETIYSAKKIYFLQYLKGRDFSPPIFYLNRELDKGEVEATFVRGTTGPEGVVCNTKFWYKESGTEEKLENEDASFDFHYNTVFSELMTPRRKVQFTIADDFDHFIMKTVDMHLQKSKLFKPQVSLFLTDDDFINLFPEFKRTNSVDTDKFLKRLGVKEFEDFRARLQVISDGRRAIIKRLPYIVNK